MVPCSEQRGLLELQSIFILQGTVEETGSGLTLVGDSFNVSELSNECFTSLLSAVHVIG